MVNEMPQDQIMNVVHTNLTNSKIVEMSSNNPKQSYKVTLVPPQSVPGPYQDPLRGSPRGPFGAPGGGEGGGVTPRTPPPPEANILPEEL